MAVGSGSASGSDCGTFTFGGFGGANDFALPYGDAGAAANAGSNPASSSSLFLSARVNAFASARVVFLARPSAAGAGGGSTEASRFFAGFAGDISATTGGTPFFVCFAITSRRCFSRRRSSRHSRNESTVRAMPPRSASQIAPKNRPNENCVDMMIDRKISVRITIIEPVRLK